MASPPRHPAAHLPAQPSPLPGTEPLTPHNLRLLGRLALRHLDAGLLIYVVLMSLLLGVVWLIGGLPYGQPLNPAGAVIAAVVVFGVSLALLPLSIGWTVRGWARRSWVVGYFDATTTLLVHPTPDGEWLLSDHVTAQRGRGSARAFRRRVFQHLASEADRFGVVIVTETRVARLCQLYLDDLPGLTLVNQRRRDYVRRRIYDLRREPVATRDPD
jgi:hypothetical protein